MYTDGGIGDNSPVIGGLLTAEQHIKEIRESDRSENRSNLPESNLLTDYLVLSVGTGRKSGQLNEKTLNGTLINLIEPLIETTLYSSNEIQHATLKELFDISNPAPEARKYFRVQPVIATTRKMDDYEIVNELREEGKKYLNEQESDYKDFLQAIELDFGTQMQEEISRVVPNIEEGSLGSDSSNSMRDLAGQLKQNHSSRDIEKLVKILQENNESAEFSSGRKSSKYNEESSD